MALVLALALGCRARRPPPPTPLPDVVAFEVDALDVPAPQDVFIRDRSPEAPRPRARVGAWRALPRVDLNGVEPLARQEDAPDRDGDELPDPMVAVAWNTVATRCMPVSATRPCPPATAADPGPSDRDGPLVLGFLTVYSGEAAGDAGAGVARVVGTRRVWRSSAWPTVTLGTVDFAEFGAGVLARASLTAVDGVGTTDTVDVVDLFVGDGAERHAGALVHHCRVTTAGTSRREGSLGLTLPALAPLVFRAAMARPFTGCAADLAPWEQSVATLFAGGVRVHVTRDEASPARGGHVAIVRDGEALHALDRGAVAYREPLSDNDLRVTTMDRLCRGDRVRWHVGARVCQGVVPRDDGPLQGCAAPMSSLDPTRAQAVAVLAPPEATHATLLFTRGAGLLAAQLPRACRHATLAPATPWTGPAPTLSAASPDGARVLVAQGLDLWLGRRDHETPRLVNGPGSGLPRGTIRALAFLDERTVAAVISTRFVTFTLDVETEDPDPPDGLASDLDELRRGLR